MDSEDNMNSQDTIDHFIEAVMELHEKTSVGNVAIGLTFVTGKVVLALFGGDVQQASMFLQGAFSEEKMRILDDGNVGRGGLH